MINSLNINNQLPLTTLIVTFASYGIYSALVGIIALILIFVLYIQFIMRGIEIFVLKLGFPLTCVGLVNENGGVFKSYIKKLLKSVLTVIIQIMLCKLYFH